MKCLNLQERHLTKALSYVVRDEELEDMLSKAKQGRLPTPEDVEAAKKAPIMDKEKVMRAYDKLM